MVVKNERPNSKNLVNYSKEELIQLLASIEDRYNSKSENFKTVHSKLARARVRIQVQKQRLQYLRKRIVELTPSHNLSSKA